MRRILVVVEGQTERAAFQQYHVAGLCGSRGFSIQPRIVGRPGHKGGVRSFQKVLPEILALLKQEPQSRVSTFFDFYRLPLANWPGYPESSILPPIRAVALIEAAMAAEVKKAIPDLAPERFIPYVQLHEFEALLSRILRLWRKHLETRRWKRFLLKSLQTVEAVRRSIMDRRLRQQNESKRSFLRIKRAPDSTLMHR